MSGRSKRGSLNSRVYSSTLMSQQSTSPADPPRPPKARVGGLDLSSRLYATSMLSGPLTDAAPNSVSKQM